jgi:tetratricopeptide (TPR) repeat protein
MRLVCLSLWLAVAAAAVEPQMLAFGRDGGLVAQAPAILRAGGYALAPREALYGAVSALVQDLEGRLHPVLWITGEDLDAGVAELWVGAQAPAGPDVSSFGSDRVLAAGQPAKLVPPKESGAFGLIARLESEQEADLVASSPLYDEHGLYAGWHATRLIDGRRMSFAIPPERLAAIHQTLRLTIEEWNLRHNAQKEDSYLRAIGYLWADEFDGALFYFRKSAEMTPDLARVWLHLGFVEGKAGQTERRLDCYRRAIELDPDLAEAHYLLGFALLMKGDQEGAARELRILRKLSETFASRLELFMKSVHVDVLGPDGKIRHRTRRII